MLGSVQNPARRRPPRSLRAEYEEFIEQRIEEYKDTLPRTELLRIGDDAVRELSRNEQYTLTEVLLSEQVDSIIRRRLKLPAYRRWRARHVALRRAQAQPTHWGLSPREPVVALADAIDDQDPVIVVGAADGACALFLAARGAQVTVADPNLAAIEGLENRAVAEALGSRITCLVAPLERFAPPPAFTACVIETRALADLPALARTELVERLKEATADGGRHVVMPGVAPTGAATPRLTSDALRSRYADWSMIRPPVGAGRRARNVGFMAVRPVPRQIETPLAVSI